MSVGPGIAKLKDSRDLRSIEERRIKKYKGSSEWKKEENNQNCLVVKHQYP